MPWIQHSALGMKTKRKKGAKRLKNTKLQFFKTE